VDPAEAEARIAELTTQLADATAAHALAIATHTEALADSAAQLDAARAAATAERDAAATIARADALTAAAAHDTAVLTYRDYVRQQNPLAPPELIDGATAAAVTAAAVRAQALLATVRANLTAELATNGHVPAGAPPRTTQDASSLSPLDQISAGLAARRNGT